MKVLIAAAMLVVAAAASTPPWHLQDSGTLERLRSVSAVSASVAWASGSRGTVVRTEDGGRTWVGLSVQDAAALDFRDIEAIDARTAYVLSIGAGDRSRIYKTTNGGMSWMLQFANADPRAFYDAIAFWDENDGLAVGDPVDGRFTILRTTDGGRTWALTPRDAQPAALPGDGMFAASGTCLFVQGHHNAWLATGGSARARVFRSTDQGRTWYDADTPVAAGSASAGIFSIAFRDSTHGLVVGGDYRKEQEPSDNAARTDDGGKSWTLAGTSRLRGFRSAVVFMPRSKGRDLIAVGPSGSDLSRDAGATWTSLGDLGFDAVSVDRAGDAVWAVGERGRIGRLEPSELPGSGTK